MAHRVLVVVHDCALSSSVQETMRKPAFDPMLIKGFSDVIKMIRDQKPCLVLFAVDSLCFQLKEVLLRMEQLKATRHVRKIILAQAGELDDSVTALDLGADDFLRLPISSRELEARIGASLRPFASQALDIDKQSLGSMCLYRETREVVVGDRRSSLSPREFNLLAYFMDHPGHVMNRTELLENLWLPDDEIDDQRVVDVYVWRLREKIETDPSQPERLLTRRGQGYCLVAPEL